MTQMIKNGNGTGHLLTIDKTGRALTDSIANNKIAHVSKNYGRVFTGATNTLNITTTDPYLIYVVKNTSQLYNMIIWNIAIGYNGGNTTGNKTAMFKWLIEPELTGNYVSIPAGNLNFTSPEIVDANVYGWDGNGTGITYNNGIGGTESIIGKGRTVIDLEGIPIIGFNDQLGAIIQVEEPGTITFSNIFYME